MSYWGVTEVSQNSSADGFRTVGRLYQARQKPQNKIKKIYIIKNFLSLFPIDFPTTCKDSRFFLLSLTIFKHIGISERNTPHPSPSPKIGRGGNISVILSGCYVRSTVIPNLVRNLLYLDPETSSGWQIVCLEWCSVNSE